MGSAPSRASVNVAGQSIAIVAPPGFCVDQQSTSVTSDGAFVLVSDCGLLGNSSRAVSPPIGAALTASVSPQGFAPVGEGDASEATLEELAAFAETAEGRASLGRSGQANGVRILSTTTSNDVLYLLVEDRGPQPIAGVERRFWRAFLEVDGRMTALSVLGFEGSGVDAQEGLTHLSSFAESIKAANG